MDTSVSMYDRRRVDLAGPFQIDANCINARGSLPAMNRLEAWHRDEVITIMMADVAQQEAAVGDRVRRAAAFRLMYTGMTALTPEEAHTRDRVEAILFPDGPRNQNERNDALITFHAWKYRCTLISQDGDILERRAELGKLGIRIATPGEAVAWVEERIGERDERERLLAQHYGRPPPDWVGKD